MVIISWNCITYEVGYQLRLGPSAQNELVHLTADLKMFPTFFYQQVKNHDLVTPYLQTSIFVAKESSADVDCKETIEILSCTLWAMIY